MTGPGTCKFPERPRWFAIHFFYWMCSIGFAFGLSTSVTAQEFPDKDMPYAQALQLIEQSNFKEALNKCREALKEEWSTRMEIQIQATAVKCCLMLNKRSEAIERVEEIYRASSSSSFISLLPLVWDERLPAPEQPAVNVADLQSDSAPRRLLTASALLHNPDHQQACVDILTEFRTSGLLPLNLMAETQLWRLKTFPDAAVSLDTIERWRSRLGELPEDMHAGPHFVIGRLLQNHQRLEDAALEFLWLPCMECHDPGLAASGLSQAITCLKQSGRTHSAAGLYRELQERFSQTSAAQRALSVDAVEHIATPPSVTP